MSKYNVFAIIYRRQLICDDFYLFMPCSYAEGIIDSNDKMFIDHSGHMYNSCDSYNILTSGEDLTYYFDITSSDLKNRYCLHNAYEALSKFYEEIRDVVVFGHVNKKINRIDIITLNKMQLQSLAFFPTYRLDEEEGYVKLTKTQIKKILGSKNSRDIKSFLGTLLKRNISFEKLSKEKDVEEIQTTLDTDEWVDIKLKDREIKNLQSLSIPQKKQETKLLNPNTLTVANYVKERLIGQDDAVEDLVSAVMHNMTATKPNELLKPFVIGQTGSGKSLLFKILGCILDIPVIIVDCNTIVQEGYHGKSITTILSDLYYLCNKDQNKMERAIIFFDEVDKLAARGNYVSDVGAQQALLKFIEGSKFNVEIDKMGHSIIVDTSMMTIGCGGAFEEIFKQKSHPIGLTSSIDEKTRDKIVTQDLIDYGMIGEFIGRFNLFEQYNRVTKEMMIEQLRRGLLSPLLIQNKIFERNFGVTIEFTDDYVDRLCEDAIKLKTGFRGIDLVVNTSLIKADYALQTATSPYRKLVMTSKSIDNPKVYQLIK